MTKNTKKSDAAPLQAEANVGEIFSRSERFIESYKKHILFAVLAIILIVVAALAIHHGYYLPKEKEAQMAIYPGENYLANQQWELALNGNGADYSGFLSIIDDYGITKTATLAKAYAGICYYQLGQYEEALKYLQKYNGSDKLVAPVTVGLIGDCYIETGKINEGINHFKKAADKAKSEIISPTYLRKAGTACESQGNYTEALKYYDEIKRLYPNSSEAGGIDKYIKRAEERNK